jgi:hypothetical protein
MRFASAHKMVTYLLVLAALAAVASTRALAPLSALVFAVAAALSFHVEGGGRVALALDRAAAVVRVAALALFAAVPTSVRRSICCSRCWVTSCSSGASTATTSTSRR